MAYYYKKLTKKGDKMKEGKEMTTYLIEFENKNRKKITVPATWKVTFGPAVAGVNKAVAGYQNKMPMALRFYESAEKQRAIFTDVVSFRDMSILIEEEIINTKIKEGFVEVDGTRKATSFSATVKEWLNPDKPEENNTKLLSVPSDIDMGLEDEED